MFPKFDGVGVLQGPDARHRLIVVGALKVMTADDVIPSVEEIDSIVHATSANDLRYSQAFSSSVGQPP